MAHFQLSVDNLMVTAESGAGLRVTGEFSPEPAIWPPAKGAGRPGWRCPGKGREVHPQRAGPCALGQVRPPGHVPAQERGPYPAVESVNVSSAQVSISRVFRNNIFFALNYYDYSFYNDEGYSEDALPYLGDPVDSFDLALKSPRNQARQTPFQPGGARQGPRAWALPGDGLRRRPGRPWWTEMDAYHGSGYRGQARP